MRLHSLSLLTSKDTNILTHSKMENVVVASFDPSIFSSRPLSDMAAYKTIKFEIVTRDFPRLCTAHLALHVPIVLTTAANIRKYIKAGLYPKLEAVYYDPYTRNFHLPKPIEDKTQIFESILNRTPTDTEMIRFFRRQHNIAKQNYKRVEEHRHQPKAKPLYGLDLDASSDEDEIKITHQYERPKGIEFPSRPLQTNTLSSIFCPVAERHENGHDLLDLETRNPFAFASPRASPLGEVDTKSCIKRPQKTSDLNKLGADSKSKEVPRVRWTTRFLEDTELEA